MSSAPKPAIVAPSATQIQEKKNRDVAAAIRRFLNRLSIPNRFIDAAIKMEIKEAEWDPALFKPLEEASAEEAKEFAARVDFLKGLLEQIGPNISILWESLKEAGVTVSTAHINVSSVIPGTLGVTISDDLTATLTHVGKADFQPIKTLVNLLRHIKVLERKVL